MFFTKRKEHLNNISRHVYLISNAMVLVATFMLVPIYALLVQKVGGTILHASLAMATFYLVASVNSVIIGRIIDKAKHGRNFLLAGYILMGIGYVLLYFATSFSHLLMIQVVLALADAVIYPAFDSLYARHINKKYESLEWGALESTRYLTMFVGASIGGIIVSWIGFSVLFLLMSAICLASFVNVLLMPKKLQ